MDQRIRGPRPPLLTIQQIGELVLAISHLSPGDIVVLGLECVFGNCAFYSSYGSEGSRGISVLCLSGGWGGGFVTGSALLGAVDEGIAQVVGV